MIDQSQLLRLLGLTEIAIDREIVIRPKRYRCPYCQDHPTTTQRLDWYDPSSAFTRAFEHSMLRDLI